MKDKNKNEVVEKQETIDKKELIMKLILYLLVIGYLIYFVYDYLTGNFDWENKVNIFKVVILLISIFILGIVTVTNKSIALFFSITDYILILCLIGLTVTSLISPTKKDEKEQKEEKHNLICTGRTENSAQTTIEVEYTNDTINLLKYTYLIDVDEQSHAEKLKEDFDKQYQDEENIYSEINISNDIILSFTYDMDKVNKKKINDEKLLSFTKLNDQELSNMECN